MQNRKSEAIVIQVYFTYLKAPPDAVRIIRLSAPSGNPWIHWNEECFKFLAEIK